MCNEVCCVRSWCPATCSGLHAKASVGPIACKLHFVQSCDVVLQLTERTQRAVLRYLHFTQALPYTKISRLLPSITDLRNRYEVEPECAMALLRPRLRRALLHWDAADPPVALPGAVASGAVSRRCERGCAIDAICGWLGKRLSQWQCTGSHFESSHKWSGWRGCGDGSSGQWRYVPVPTTRAGLQLSALPRVLQRCMAGPPS